MMRRWLLLLPLLLVLAGCSIGDERWRAEAERPWNEDWAAYSCQSIDRFSQVSPGLFNQKAYRIEVRDGDNSFGERCELSLGNTSNSNYKGPASIFHEGDQLLIHFAIKLGPYTAFAPPGAPVGVPEEAGLIHQIKQLGSCGTPALGIVATRTEFVVRNSRTATCENDTMHTLQRWPRPDDKWIQIAQLVKFSTNPAVGRYAVWTKVEGEDWVWRGEVHTHTMKSPTDHPASSCPEPTPCSHGRIGFYRDPDVQGTSVGYWDAYWVAEWRD